jgi:hypothetical protein
VRRFKLLICFLGQGKRLKNAFGTPSLTAGLGLGYLYIVIIDDGTSRLEKLEPRLNWLILDLASPELGP